jgi:hypothetical protein
MPPGSGSGSGVTGAGRGPGALRLPEVSRTGLAQIARLGPSVLNEDPYRRGLGPRFGSTLCASALSPLRRLAAATTVPLCASETVATPGRFADLLALDPPAVHHVMYDLGW